MVRWDCDMTFSVAIIIIIIIVIYCLLLAYHLPGLALCALHA